MRKLIALSQTALKAMLTTIMTRLWHSIIIQHELVWFLDEEFFMTGSRTASITSNILAVLHSTGPPHCLPLLCAKNQLSLSVFGHGQRLKAGLFEYHVAQLWRLCDSGTVYECRDLLTYLRSRTGLVVVSFLW